MRILWSSNAPWVRTGYGVQTKLTCERIQKSDRHKIAAIFGWCGLEAGSLNWGEIPILPKHHNSHPFGADLLGYYAQRLQVDIAITLIDAWVQEPDNLPPDVRWVPYFPVDHDPIPPLVRDKVGKAFARINYSQYGVEKCKEAGLDSFYVPHMVDTDVFHPVPKEEARAVLGFPQDAFIVGMVAANKGYPSRKSFPECLEAFAEFAKETPNALLWLHTNIGGNDGMGGVDIRALIAQFGLQNVAMYVRQDEYNCGLDDNWMRNLYNSFDVFLNPAQGEGFGVPIVEAQACGVSVITGDWTSQTEVTGSGWLVTKEEADRIWTPQYSFQYRPRPSAIYDRLKQAYALTSDQRADMAATAREFVLDRYAADFVMEKHWLPVLDCIAQRVEGAKALASRFQQAMKPQEVTT